MATRLAADTVDSIRLKRRDYNFTVNSDLCKLSQLEPSFIRTLRDLDVSDLEKQFTQISAEFKNSMQDLRNDPSNLSKKESVLRTKQKLDQITLWTSKLTTEEGQQILNEHRENTEKQKYEIDKVLKVVKAQTAIDICFMMDCTRSMKPYIDGVKNDIMILIETTSSMFGTIPRLAFIGYSDVHCKKNSLISKDFTTDVDYFKQFVDNIYLVSGKDHCEDVFSGLEKAPTLTWSSPNRVLVHICDAPCHGETYYNQEKLSKMGDKWDLSPGGDPYERDVHKLLGDIKCQNIQYVAIELNKNTKRMFEKFQIIFGPILRTNLKNPTDIMIFISKTATNMIMSTVEGSMSIFKTTQRRKHYMLITNEPNWNVMNTYSVQITDYILPNTIEDLFGQLLIGNGNGKMQIACNPFAQGSLRYAYYGKLASDDSSFLDVVYKELISAEPQYTTLEAYKQHLEIQTIAQFLANCFNDAQGKVFRNPTEVLYADASIVQLIDDPNKIYQVECRFMQTIQKWSNNCGGVHFDNYSDVLHAFSHWTYHATGGRIMVVDLQGVKSFEDGKYLLTDPAIHFSDITRCKLARTNFGAKGMREFFRTHMCSKLCEKLGLEKITNNMDENIVKQFYKSTDLFTITPNGEKTDEEEDRK